MIYISTIDFDRNNAEAFSSIVSKILQNQRQKYQKTSGTI